MEKRIDEHSFSVEMKSKEAVRSFSYIKNEGNFFFEGSLGALKNISLIEDAMLEIEGKNGIIKLDINSQEIRKIRAKSNNKNGGEMQ